MTTGTGHQKVRSAIVGDLRLPPSGERDQGLAVVAAAAAAHG
jgi:hypothetical protein